MDDDFPCHWTHNHPRHRWIPIIADPGNDHLLFLDQVNMIWCPGKGQGGTMHDQPLFLNEDEFDQEYEPLSFPIGEEGGSLMCEHPDTLAYPASRVWSVVEVDGDLYAIPGYHVVNVIGYHVTKKPWPHENVEVKFDGVDE